MLYLIQKVLLKILYILNTPQNQLIKIANKQHKDYKLDAMYFKKI